MPSLTYPVYYSSSRLPGCRPLVYLYIFSAHSAVFFLFLTQYLFPVRPIRFSCAGRRLTLVIFSFSSFIA